MEISSVHLEPSMQADAELLKWIQEHKVCWEIVPVFAMTSGVKTQIGFELDLYAQIDRSIRTNPGCEECENIFKQLTLIARLALPADVRPTKYDIQQFDASFHLRPETKLTPEVRLALLIVHRTNILASLDECELRCAREIQTNLRDLGVQHNRWLQKRAV